MSGSDELDPIEHRRIYEELIASDPELVRATAQDAPRAIILAGQPGAGKSELARVARRELDNNVVVVDPDDLRRFHPSVGAFRSESPLTWSGRTHADASRWADQLRMDVVAGRRNLIFDTTMSDGAWTAKLINELKEDGYAVEVRAIATPKLESELGVDNRFSAQVDRLGYGRFVPQQVQEPNFEKLPRGLDFVRANTDAPVRIFVSRRVSSGHTNNRTSRRNAMTAFGWSNGSTARLASLRRADVAALVGRISGSGPFQLATVLRARSWTAICTEAKLDWRN